MGLSEEIRQKKHLGQISQGGGKIVLPDKLTRTSRKVAIQSSMSSAFFVPLLLFQSII